MRFHALLVLLLCVPIAPHGYAATDNAAFNDRPLDESLVLPEWFKTSFLELGDDLLEANTNERGLILYFGRHDCPYCKAQLEQNWGQPDIDIYTRAHFDVVAIDVLGNRLVTDFDGRILSEKAFAIEHKAHFTPSLFFYDRHGKLALQLTGYRPAYQFRAALEYVADAHHRKEEFHRYLARAESAFSYGQDTLNEHPDFHPVTRLAQRGAGTNQPPLLVSFERTRCHACDVLHAGPLHNLQIRRLLQQLDAVQVDMREKQVVHAPTGQTMRVQQWSDQLSLSYAPTLIFFDIHGREIIRVDSVVGFYRLRGVLQYVTSGAYQQIPNFQQWRIHQHEMAQ